MNTLLTIRYGRTWWTTCCISSPSTYPIIDLKQMENLSIFTLNSLNSSLVASYNKTWVDEMKNNFVWFTQAFCKAYPAWLYFGHFLSNTAS
ncbi:hypothetical protein [Phaffia rhodozyma]|uniref:Uncharacterized protein n=1 Tax=Phaffia rhodozyma TaxID=264483 RepID=A0A0F7SS89_PHARH|nr:hypothetical protein [Phaffia rhodozyma]